MTQASILMIELVALSIGFIYRKITENIMMEIGHCISEVTGDCRERDSLDQRIDLVVQ